MLFQWLIGLFSSRGEVNHLKSQLAEQWIVLLDQERDLQQMREQVRTRDLNLLDLERMQMEDLPRLSEAKREIRKKNDLIESLTAANTKLSSDAFVMAERQEQLQSEVDELKATVTAMSDDIAGSKEGLQYDKEKCAAFCERLRAVEEETTLWSEHRTKLEAEVSDLTKQLHTEQQRGKLVQTQLYESEIKLQLYQKGSSSSRLDKLVSENSSLKQRIKDLNHNQAMQDLKYEELKENLEKQVISLRTEMTKQILLHLKSHDSDFNACSSDHVTPREELTCGDSAAGPSSKTRRKARGKARGKPRGQAAACGSTAKQEAFRQACLRRSK